MQTSNENRILEELKDLTTEVVKLQVQVAAANARVDAILSAYNDRLVDVEGAVRKAVWLGAGTATSVAAAVISAIVLGVLRI